MTAPVPLPPSAPASVRSSHRTLADVGVALLTVLLVSWFPTHWGGAAWAGPIDSIVFALIGPVVALAYWQLSDRVAPADRLAWRLLAVAALARSLSGLVWGQWILLFPGASEPIWLLSFKWSYLGFASAGLLQFPSRARRAADRFRYRLDLAMALVGSAMLAWYFALGPFFSTRAISADYLDDLVHAAGDSVVVALAAALHLRAATPLVRRAALWLLAAAVMQVVPDVWFWRTTAPAQDPAFDLVGAAWYAAWLLKWLAARTSELALDRSVAATDSMHDGDATDDVIGSPLPAAFLVIATILQFGALVGGPMQQERLLAGGSLALATLLVARQFLEFRERNRLQRVLQHDAARQRALLNRAYDAIVLLDRDGRLVYASPALEALVAAVSDRTKPWSVLERIHPDDHAGLRAAVIATSPPTRALAIRLEDRTGAWRQFEGSLQDLRDDPMIEGFVLNGLDRTRERQLEEGLRDAQQFEALGVMASGLAHDLGNTLTVIASHVDLLRDDTSMTPRALVDLQAIRSASDRARALTAGLLALSRRKSASTAMVAIDGAVRDRVRARARSLAVRVAADATAPMARVNRDALMQLVDAVIDEAHAEDVAIATESVRDDHGDMGLPIAPEITIDVCRVRPDVAEALHVDAGEYVVIGVGDVMQPAADNVLPAIRTDQRGEWDLSPSDLSMLMALAAARELGGTVSRERQGTARRFAIYVPSVPV